MDKQNPKVSVIIPVYNQAAYVKAAIQSVLLQTYRDFEIVVIDDGSTDNSREVISKFGSLVHYIYQENQGLAGARNTGIHAARGEFIGLLDSDDEWLPDYLSSMIYLAAANPDASVYYCQARCMDEDGNDLGRLLGGPARTPKTVYPAMLRSDFLIPSTILIRRSVLFEIGLFDQSLRSNEDWDLWLRLLPKHTFIGTMACLIRYRLHGSSLSVNLEGMHKAAFATVEKNFGKENEDFKYWLPEKRRAYGGLYRFKTLTFVIRQGNWHEATRQLSRGLQIDPTLALDKDLFNDLARGSQPIGDRDSDQQIDIPGNASHMTGMLAKIFSNPAFSSQKTLHRQAYGTAYMALGLVAYNTNENSLSRKFLFKAVQNRPELLKNTLVISDILKSFFNPAIIKRIKKSQWVDSLKPKKNVESGD